ncbi:DUF2076 domain-containing protein [Mesorhizobium sp. DCY119]|uniref:DUF2076 domain-containing protein n=1 Tax=Mesorhizobium sp. DCY119 TaxID=2108445 RepID=UPI000E7265F9|nr:DUF2076 domain-containing protein [Mesorhizobium sp. DCY119]RJG40338.1 DUF2076 domain-containing protein [Mesorhizobium sp. DCY119]
MVGLFDKLADVARQSLPRDREAQAYIGEQIACQPGAPYYVAQTIVVQEQALKAAQARIEELERGTEASPASGRLPSGILGDDRHSSRSTRTVPRIGHATSTEQDNAISRGYPRRAGGGFLAGAVPTAMGVAVGVLLGDAIAGMFGGSEAQATEATEAPQARRRTVQ